MTISARAMTPKTIRPRIEKLGRSGLAITQKVAPVFEIGCVQARLLPFRTDLPGCGRSAGTRSEQKANMLAS